MKKAYKLAYKIGKGKAFGDEVDKYKNIICGFCDYLDCVHDLFEHKFLVFLCNPSDIHWFTFVMVNQLLIYNKGHLTKTWKEDNNVFAGWCVFDFLAWTKAEQPQAKETGLISTTQSIMMHLTVSAIADQEE